MPVIGFLSTRSPSESANVVAAFRRGLGEAELVEGQNCLIAFRWAESRYDQLPALAAELVDLRVAVLFAAGGAARRSVYCASKHAMEGFTKAMAIELAPHNIRVNSLGPTFIDTPMTRPYFENRAFRDEVLAKIKLGRLGQLDEVTGAIVFLASDASSLMTGAALVLDGGWTAE